MRKTPQFTTEDETVVKRLIRENPWATYVSSTATGLVASHYATLLEEDADGISIVSHFGRPDEKLHELGQHEVLVIVRALTATFRRAGMPRATSSRPGIT